LVPIPSVVQELSRLQDFYGYCWLALTFDPVTFWMSSASCGPAIDQCGSVSLKYL